MPRIVKEVGAYTILGMLFISLSIAFAPSVASTISEIKPLKKSVDVLIIESKEQHALVNEQLGELATMIYEQNIKVTDGRARLKIVEEKCNENHEDIKMCREVKHTHTKEWK